MCDKDQNGTLSFRVSQNLKVINNIALILGGKEGLQTTKRPSGNP